MTRTERIKVTVEAPTQIEIQSYIFSMSDEGMAVLKSEYDSFMRQYNNVYSPKGQDESVFGRDAETAIFMASNFHEPRKEYDSLRQRVTDKLSLIVKVLKYKNRQESNRHAAILAEWSDLLDKAQKT
jgi:hypothetical protein